MNILFELSKEHKILPKDEVISCFDAENITYKIIKINDNIILIKSDIDLNTIKNISKRLAYSYYVDQLFFSCSNSVDEIKKCAKKEEVNISGTVAIRYTTRGKVFNSKKIVDAIADIYTINNKVNLTNPDNEIRVFITDSKVYVGNKICAVDRSQYEKRRVHFRPFFSPISLHPKLARALVNLSSIKENQTLLDPFCGTGGILLEAGLIGAKIIGSDVEEKMINGSKKTLDYYNIDKYDLFCSDIGEIKDKIDLVDAIVTDMPYGISTTTKGEEMKKLYERSFKVFKNILNEGSKIVVGLSNKNDISIGEKYFNLLKVYDMVAHKSLTRFFAVYQN
jgi:tRNA (guanine10-N2)-dimethyltransferase